MTNNKHLFKSNQNRKKAREAFGPLDDQGVKGLQKNVGKLAEKLNKSFVSVFTVESVMHGPRPQPLFFRNKI